MRANILRIRLYEAIKKRGKVLNTCQWCRIIHGTGENNIQFCRGAQSRKIIQFRKDSYFNPKGGPYPNCHIHIPTYNQVYRALKRLKENGFIQSRRMRYADPQKRGKAWDTMRMWALDLTPILKEKIWYYQ